MAVEDTTRAAVQRYCASIARDRLLVQAAGGNISWKSGSTLWIKASGTWLADAETKDIFVPVDRQPLDAALARGDYAVSPRALEGNALRPSIETLLHALMPHSFVVHLHPVDAVAHLVRCNCEVELQAALGDAFAWELVDYHKPGADLARAVHAKLLEKPGVQVVFLKNHGVIVGAETLVEIDRLLKALNERLVIQPRPLYGAVTSIHELTASVLDGTVYQVSTDEQIHCLASDLELYQRLGDSWVICPDHVVFLGAVAVRVDELTDLGDTVLSVDPAPPFVFVKDMGVLENRAATLAQRAQLTFYLDVMIRQPASQPLETLSHDQIASLLNWDAEKYRLALNQQ
jgi:rhamnose utilization protein RhaD (predicted bifunctional aldolase and dehydrogenase)